MKRLRKHNSVNVVLLLFLFVAGTGCGDFLDINKDPNAATSAPLDLLFTAAVVTQQSQRGIELIVLHPTLSQHWASHNSAGGLFLNPERYSVNSGDFTISNSWDFYYTDALSDLETAATGAMQADPVRENAAAQARLMQAYIFYQLTASWGPIPFSQALEPEEFPDPVFDSQEDVLRSLVTRIDDAIALIDPSSEIPAITSNDLIYKGDMDEWLRFANSLKLRILMLIYNVDSSVASQIETILNQPLIRSNADNAEFPYTTDPGNENQFFQVHDDFAGGGPLEDGESFFFGNKVLVDMMNDRGDPRRSTYFETNFENKYVGVPAGSGEGEDSTFSEIGAAINRPAFPGRMITASEVLLHEAEFLASQGQTLQARSSLEAGIRASMDYFDGLMGEISESDEDSYVSDILLQYDTASDPDKIRIIQEEHYIDVFEKTPENWTLWKRTKVPTLPLPENAFETDFLRRLPYPSDEQSSNENFPETVQSKTTPMWFDNP